MDASNVYPSGLRILADGKFMPNCKLDPFI